MYDNKQLKYTIEGVSKILIPQDKIKGSNKNLANFWNGILLLFYHTETNFKLLDA